MTATKLKLRVWVPAVWDMLQLEVSDDTTVEELKDLALTRATLADVPSQECEVKFRGALVLNETQTLGELGVPQKGALIVLPRHRQPVSR